MASEPSLAGALGSGGSVVEPLLHMPPGDGPPKVTLLEAERFLRWLDPSTSLFTFQAIRPGVKAPIIHGPLSGDLARRLERENLAGAGIYVMINEGDGRWRSAENVTRIRCIFVDSDGTPLPPPEDLQAHAIIQSSNVPHKWHAYWRVRDVPLRYFAAIQKGLIATYNTDTGVHDLPRVMRLPGFLHLKEEPFMTRSWWLDHDAPPLALAELSARWPLVADAVRAVDHPSEKPSTPPPRLAPSGRGSYAWKALEGEYEALKATREFRHDALLKAACRLGSLVPALLDEDVVHEALVLAADANGYLAKVGVGQAEVDRVIRDGLRHGMASPRQLEVA